MDINLDKDSIQRLIKESETEVLTVFWAPWCGYCQKLVPIIDELAKEYEGKIGVYEINVDKYGDIAQEFDVLSVPTVYMVKKGVVVEKFSGSRTKEDIAKFLDKYIK